MTKNAHTMRFEAQAKALVTYKKKGLSNAEIGGITGQSREAVARQVARARRRGFKIPLERVDS